MIQHKKKFGIYHWDTFDNETILIAEKDTFEAAKKFVHKTYKDRINNKHGADQVDIVDKDGNIVLCFKVI